MSREGIGMCPALAAVAAREGRARGQVIGHSGAVSLGGGGVRLSSHAPGGETALGEVGGCLKRTPAGGGRWAQARGHRRSD